MPHGHLLHVALWTILGAQDLFGSERQEVQSELWLWSLISSSAISPCHDVYIQLGDIIGKKEVVVASLASDQSGNSSVPLLWLEYSDSLVHRWAGGKGQTVSCSCFDSQATNMDTWPTITFFFPFPASWSIVRVTEWYSPTSVNTRDCPGKAARCKYLKSQPPKCTGWCRQEKEQVRRGRPDALGWLHKPSFLPFVYFCLLMLSLVCLIWLFWVKSGISYDMFSFLDKISSSFVLWEMWRGEWEHFPLLCRFLQSRVYHASLHQIFSLMDLSGLQDLKGHHIFFPLSGYWALLFREWPLLEVLLQGVYNFSAISV